MGCSTWRLSVTCPPPAVAQHPGAYQESTRIIPDHACAGHQPSRLNQARTRMVQVDGELLDQAPYPSVRSSAVALIIGPNEQFRGRSNRREGHRIDTGPSRPPSIQRPGPDFLTSQAIVRQIVDVLEPSRSDLWSKWGLGSEYWHRSCRFGQAGRRSQSRSKAVLCRIWKCESYSKNLRVIDADALDLDPAAFVPQEDSYLFAANLPYSAASAIVRRFLELESPPRRAVAMVQREVAERMTADPPGMSLLGLAVQNAFHARIAFHVSVQRVQASSKSRIVCRGDETARRSHRSRRGERSVFPSRSRGVPSEA